MTFSKRKAGLFKKAHELAILCSVDVALIIIGPNNKVFQYSSAPSDDILSRYQKGDVEESKTPGFYGDYDVASRVGNISTATMSPPSPVSSAIVTQLHEDTMQSNDSLKRALDSTAGDEKRVKYTSPDDKIFTTPKHSRSKSKTRPSLSLHIPGTSPPVPSSLQLPLQQQQSPNPIHLHQQHQHQQQQLHQLPLQQNSHNVIPSMSSQLQSISNDTNGANNIRTSQSSLTSQSLNNSANNNINNNSNLSGKPKMTPTFTNDLPSAISNYFNLQMSPTNDLNSSASVFFPKKFTPTISSGSLGATINGLGGLGGLGGGTNSPGNSGLVSLSNGMMGNMNGMSNLNGSLNSVNPAGGGVGGLGSISAGGGGPHSANASLNNIASSASNNNNPNNGHNNIPAMNGLNSPLVVNQQHFFKDVQSPSSYWIDNKLDISPNGKK